MASSKTRQRKLARAKMERQLARRAVRARRQRQLRAGIAVGLVLVVGLFAGLWAGGVFSSTKKPAAAATCAWNKPANTQSLTDVGMPPTSGEPRSGTETMTITTNQGTIAVDLDLAKAPCAAASFSYLAGKNFFNNTKCHRLTTSGSYILQCGDPKADGTGGPAYTFADEYLPTAAASPSASASSSASATASPSASAASASPSASTEPTVVYPRGIVAMANSGADTNGSQFFIVYKDSSFQPNYTEIGTVSAGLDVVDKIAAAGTADGSADGKPKTDVTIQTLTVTKPGSPSTSPSTSGSAEPSTEPSASASPSSTPKS